MALSKDDKINVGVGLSIVGSLFLGFRRLAGAISAGAAIYDYNRGRKTRAAVEGGLGALFLLAPEWPETLAGAFKPAATTTVVDKQTKTTVPIIPASLFDTDIGGGWEMLDARGMRPRQFDTDADIHVGQIASLVLQPGGASSKVPVKVFNAKIINKTGDDFSGQWVGGAPSNGPQLIDFRGANIFDFHG